MDKIVLEEGRYRVLLIGVGGNSKEEKDSFCHNLSKNYNIPPTLLKKIVDRRPIILKKNLSLKKAEILAKTLKSFGATVSVEERRNFPPISLEFQELVPHQLALESSYLRKAPKGTWSIIGRIKNISDEMLSDTWALIQLFDVFGEFINFEETPLTINPLPAGEVSPFKVVFEGDFTIKRISIAFKNASGQPIPAVDKRKKREWVEVEINDEDEHVLSSQGILPEMEQRSGIIELTEPSEEMVTQKEMKISIGTIPALVEELDISLGEGMREEQGEIGETVPEGSFSLTLDEDFSERIFEPPIKDLENSENFPEGNGYHEREGFKSPSEIETFQGPPFSVSARVEEIAIEEKALGDLEPSAKDEGVATESTSATSVFEEVIPLLEDVYERPEEVEGEAKKEFEVEGTVEEVREEGESGSSFPWIEYFKNTVEAFHQRPRDIFSMWFEERRKGGEFMNSLHALLTILVHSRFDQANRSAKALENTQRVYRIIVQRNLFLEEVPPLDGTTFVSGEVWRDLFHRALPKVQQIGSAILEKSKWNAFDLEQMIRVIPHVGYQNSRSAIRSIHELIPDIIEVDFSNTPVAIEESLYRVASRLGIVDPHFDYFQGKNSMGDIKIQFFAKTVFPQNPTKIEEPMAWMGMEEERGGHCFPTQPRCEGCLFETFCPRLYFHFNPSEEGMRK
jgi:hypothetical protein